MGLKGLQNCSAEVGEGSEGPGKMLFYFRTKGREHSSPSRGGVRREKKERNGTFGGSLGRRPQVLSEESLFVWDRRSLNSKVGKKEKGSPPLKIPG